ncbi:MAG: hypothetical protein JOY78_06090 [Pseudonocardia sp.]|nr:hypothetical protein [Pseudonocardia sp.]
MAFSGGRFLVAWYQGGAYRDTAVTTSGTVAHPGGRTVAVSHPTAGTPQLAANRAGFVLAYTTSDAANGRIVPLDASGAKTGNGTNLSNAAAVVGSTPDGAVVAWHKGSGVATSRLTAAATLVTPAGIVVPVADADDITVRAVTGTAVQTDVAFSTYTFDGFAESVDISLRLLRLGPDGHSSGSPVFVDQESYCVGSGCRCSVSYTGARIAGVLPAYVTYVIDSCGLSSTYVAKASGTTVRKASLAGDQEAAVALRSGGAVAVSSGPDDDPRVTVQPVT